MVAYSVHIYKDINGFSPIVLIKKKHPIRDHLMHTIQLTYTRIWQLAPNNSLQVYCHHSQLQSLPSPSQSRYYDDSYKIFLAIVFSHVHGQILKWQLYIGMQDTLSQVFLSSRNFKQHPRANVYISGKARVSV